MLEFKTKGKVKEVSFTPKNPEGRFKQVFSNADDVIHLFAQRSQYSANSGNIFFEGNKIYSYGHHYILAEFLDDNTIMINDRGYSVTTSKHIGKVGYATSQYRQYYLTNCDAKMVQEFIEENFDKLGRARKKQRYIDAIQTKWRKYNEFLEEREVVGVKNKSTYKQLKKLVESLSSEGLSEYLKAKVKADKIARKKSLDKNLSKFKAYKLNYIDHNQAYLRISTNGERVETSQGAHVLIDDARTLYKMIKKGIEIKGHRIGYYTVTSLNDVLTIGCHKINKKSMVEIGEKILK